MARLTRGIPRKYAAWRAAVGVLLLMFARDMLIWLVRGTLYGLWLTISSSARGHWIALQWIYRALVYRGWRFNLMSIYAAVYGGVAAVVT